MNKKIFWLFFIILVGTGFSFPVFSAWIEPQNNVQPDGLFSVGPTAFEVEMKPGESTKRILQVTNKEGHDQGYMIETEDFEGAQRPGDSIFLRGQEKGKFSAREWIKPELSAFTLKHGERQFFEINIEAPQTADAGDHYVAVLVSRAPEESGKEESEKTSPATNVKSRVGALFFIRIMGDTREEGSLESFQTDRNWYEKGPINFRLAFRNTGTVRLRPQAKIEIKDTFGKMMDTLEIEPFNVLRDSVRQAESSWSRKYLAGRYEAKLILDPDFGENLIEKTIIFWVIPWKVIVIVFIIFIILASLIIFIRKNVSFNIQFKKKLPENVKEASEESSIEKKQTKELQSRGREYPRAEAKKAEIGDRKIREESAEKPPKRIV